MSKVIVMIDDDATKLAFASDIVELEMPGYSLTPIFGDVSGDILGQIPTKVDAFFVDYDMIGIKGPEIIGDLLKMHPRARIVGWTAYLDEEKRTEFESAGATEVMEKPDGMDDLIKVIR